MKSEFLMLAKTYVPGSIDLLGWYVSEKLDGIRAFWDGGISRGIPAAEVPYANTVKDHRLIKEVIATGLWSRTGKVIYAPDYWLDGLPNLTLDGELWLGRNDFQELTSIVSTKDGSTSDAWDYVEYKIFDSPSPNIVFSPRTITVRDYDYNITGRMPEFADGSCSNFNVVYQLLEKMDLGRAELHHQEILVGHRDENEKQLQGKLDALLLLGAEGVMLRNGISYWTSQRSKNLLKYKPWRDAEGVITGFTSGRDTTKGGRLLGKIGALVLEYDGKRLELSGLTDDERAFSRGYEREWAEEHPGEDMPEDFVGKHFKFGDTVTFKYRELSDSGIPKEARYWRKS